MNVQSSDQRHSACVLLLYFAVPVVLGIVAAPKTPLDVSTTWIGVVIWSTHFLLVWIFCFLALALLSRVRLAAISGRPQIFVAAAVLGLAIARPVFWVRYQLQSDYLITVGSAATEVRHPFTVFEFSFRFFLMIGRIYLPSVVAWVFFTMIADRYFGLLHVAPEHAIGSTATISKVTEGADLLSAGVEDGIGTAVFWMKAEGHYTLVATRAGQELLYYRFGDAVQQLTASGTQVHRSYWVSYDCLGSEATRLKNGSLELADGATIPIGPSYVAKVKDALTRARANGNAISKSHETRLPLREMTLRQ